MKKVLLLTLCLSILITATIGCSRSPGLIGKDNHPNKNSNPDITKINTKVRDGNLEFAFDIFKTINKEDEIKNVFVSPFSISTALTMTYEGAQGNTKDIMAKTLGYPGIEDENLRESFFHLIGYLGKPDKKVELDISNSLWVRDGVPVGERFVRINEDTFGAPVTNLDFSKDESIDEINKWISESTKGKIDEMLEPPIAQDVIMYIINAIYFKGDWAEKFDKSQSFSKEFHPEKGPSHDVMMMRRLGDVEYGEGDDYQAIRLPYGDGKMAMYCLLPNTNTSINDFLATLDMAKWESIKSSIEKTNDVSLEIPRFKMEYGIKSLKDSLISLGMEEAFSDRADFRGIKDGVYISDVLHKAIIEVNEEGSEAAAATVVEKKETAMKIDPKTFIADRPFMFLIVDDKTGTILFMGKVYDPV